MMSLGAKIWLEEKDAEKFLGNILGHDTTFAAAHQFQRHLEVLEKSESSSNGMENLALLYRHAGNVLLDQENPAQAEQFLAKSVQLFREVERETTPSTSRKAGKKKSKAKLKESTLVGVKRMLAEVLLARSWVRNYDNIERARKVLDAIISNSASCANVATAEVYINALLTKVELLVNFDKSFNRIDEVNEICSEKVHAPFGVFIEHDQHEIFNRFRVDLAVLFCNYVNFDPIACNSSIQLLANSDDANKYHTAKAILRQGKAMANLHAIDAEGCIFEMRGFHSNSCALATAYYIQGERLLDKWLSKSEECFQTSFELRETHLGPTHVDTARAQFEMGRVRASKADKCEDLDPKILKDLKTALDSFQSHNNGLYSFNSNALQFHAELLGRCGRLHDAIPFFEKSIQIEDQLDDICSPMGSLRRFDLGKLYEQFQKWTKAIELYEEAVRGISGDSRFRSNVADIYCHLGYCNCKLERYEKAAQLFKLARDGSQYCDIDEFKIVIKVLLQQAENEFRSGNHALSREIFLEGISLRLDFKNDAKIMLDETWSAIHLQMAFYYEYVDISLDLAKEYYGNVLKYLEQVVHHAHPSICEILLSLSRVALKQDNLVLSEGHAFRCLKIAESLPEPNDLFLKPIVSIFNKFLNQRTNVKKAKAVFLSYQDRFAKMQILEDSTFIASFSLNFAKRLYNEEYTSAEESASFEKSYFDLFQKSFGIFEKICGKGDAKTAESQRMLGLCFLKSGRLAEAEWHLLHSAVVLQSPDPAEDSAS